MPDIKWVDPRISNNGDNWHLVGPMESDLISKVKERPLDSIIEKITDIKDNDKNAINEEELYISNLCLLNKGGLPWIIEPLEQLQPESYKVLAEHASPLKFWIHWFEKFPNRFILLIRMYIVVKERIVHLANYGFERTYESGTDTICKEALEALPEVISHSWLWRGIGWQISDDYIGQVVENRRLIGYPFSSWKVADHWLDSFGRGYKKKYLPQLLEMFPDMYTKTNGIKRYNLECFLDSRPAGLYGPYGDQLLVCTTRQDKKIYHIHDGDVDNLRIINNPGELIDQYCAHTLLRTPGRFDFMPWSEPYK